MTAIITKVKVLPVPAREEKRFMKDLVLDRISAVKAHIDSYGKEYEHENPWCEAYLGDPKFYLYRIKIGAIGRVNTCSDAIDLGIMHRVVTKSYHFTSMALYFVFRIARETQREIHYTKKLEGWINNLLSNKQAWNRFMNYDKLESTECYDDDEG